MMPDMLERVDLYLTEANIYDNWESQLEFWNDSGKPKDRFIVLQSNGGTQVRDGLANDFYFSLYIVGRQGQENVAETKEKALQTIEYIKDHPLDGCLNYIQLQSPLGRPTLTEEKRVVYELLLRVVGGG